MFKMEGSIIGAAIGVISVLIGYVIGSEFGKWYYYRKQKKDDV